MEIRKLKDRTGEIRIDEVFAKDVQTFHLEQMGDNEYLLIFEVGGQNYHLSFTSRGKVKATIWRDSLEDSEAADVTTLKNDFLDEVKGRTVKGKR